jgi:hypothetical protein
MTDHGAGVHRTARGTGMNSSQHTPGMNDYAWQLVIHSYILLNLWEEEGVGLGAFNIIVIVYWYIHEVAASFVFGMDQHVRP